MTSKSYVEMETEPSEIQLSIGSGHAVVACYLELYEEGEVEISTCPIPPYPGTSQVLCYHLLHVLNLL